MRLDKITFPRAPGQAQLTVAATYRSEWNDGYGARGWKLDSTMHDGDVIASTGYSGDKVPTSVFVHDIVDHLICGFGPSGHRNEAKATTQLGLRVGTEIRSSFEAMVDDVVRDRIVGESLSSFLDNPPLYGVMPGTIRSHADLHRIELEIGTDRLRSLLITHFYEIGLGGIPEAMGTWQKRGLDYARRFGIGMALQQLIVDAERDLVQAEEVIGHGHFVINNEACALNMTWTNNGGRDPKRQTLMLRHPVVR